MAAFLQESDSGSGFEAAVVTIERRATIEQTINR